MHVCGHGPLAYRQLQAAVSAEWGASNSCEPSLLPCIMCELVWIVPTNLPSASGCRAPQPASHLPPICIIYVRMSVDNTHYLAYRQFQIAGHLDQPTSLEVQQSVDFHETVLRTCVDVMCGEVWKLLPWWISMRQS